jgi:pilus assembly protein Flp/PilA
MKNLILKLSAKGMQRVMNEEGQDLIEYALVVALIAFGALIAIGSLANDLNAVFSNLGTMLSSAT